MSIFDAVEHVPDAPTWRCPHCRTLQPESSRCRACQRSAVSCATCHLYRNSLVGDVGFCAHDPARTPLRGDEARPCWVAGDVGRLPAGGLFGDLTPSPASTQQPAVAVPVTPAIPYEPRAPRADAIVEGEPAERAGRLMDAPHVAPLGSLEPSARGRASRGRG